jgi:hypothetical protein
MSDRAIDRQMTCNRVIAEKYFVLLGSACSIILAKFQYSVKMLKNI